MMDAATLRKIDGQFAAIRSMPIPIPTAERYRHTVENLRLGGFVRFNGKTFTVIEEGKYTEGKGKSQWTWTEYKLLCLETGETCYIEWEKDDEVEIYLTTAALSLRDLRDGAGNPVTGDSVEAMSDRERGTITYGGRGYEYDDDYRATYRRGGSAEGEEAYFYDFESPDGTCLTIEEWGNEKNGFEYEVYLSRQISVNDIEMLVVGAS